MSNVKAVSKTDAPAAPARNSSLVTRFAERYGVDPDKMMATLKATAFRQSAKDGKVVEISNEQMMALLVVASEYKLNPFTKEIYAFPDKGGIVPIVSVDGWIRIINERPELDYIEFEYAPDDCEPNDAWTRCTIARKDRGRPLTIVEYFRECYRDTGPWNDTGRRMLRHRALIQCARIAFGFAGIYDPDEAQRIVESRTIEGSVVSEKAGTRAPEAKALPAPAPADPEEVETKAAAGPRLAAALVRIIEQRAEKYSVAVSRVLAHFEVGALDQIPFDKVDDALEFIVHADDAA